MKTALILLSVLVAASIGAKLNSLEVVDILTHSRVFDLTHSFNTTTPLWYGFPAPTEQLMYWYDESENPTDGTGFFVQRFCHPGQDGTHMDAPAHFVQGTRTIDEIELEELILPLVIIDVSAKVRRNPDYVVTMRDIRDWEDEYGDIPADSFVALRTDWYKRWSQGLEGMENKDANGVPHTPGWSEDVLTYLYEDVGITASGHEMLDTDAGLVTYYTESWPLEDYILRSNHYQIEVMANLDKPDEAGCLASVLLPKVVAGSGFPARVIAICPQAHEKRFASAMKQLLDGEWYDLTHEYSESVPHWKGFDNTATRETLYWYQDDGVVTPVIDYGFFAERFCHVGQWSTHCDPPAHFHEGLRTLDQIPVSQMVSPLVIIDVSEKVALNPDYVITMDDINDWEEAHDVEVPAGAFVGMRTDWKNRWPSQEDMANKDADGVFHYPGWSQEVLTYLLEERNVNAVGHETTDTDPGLSTTLDDYSLESYVLSKNHFQIELLNNLDQPLDYGCVVFSGWPKYAHGSGFSARIIAVCPDGSDHSHHDHGHGGHHHHNHHSHVHTDRKSVV